MRTPWSSSFPPVFVHAPWPKPDGLNGHPRHDSATQKRDIAGALQIAQDLINPDFVDDIFNACYHSGLDPLVVAPVSQGSCNALAATFAGYVAKELGCDIAREIYQRGSTGRDQKRDNWFRLTHEPEFSGTVESGRGYIIADDVLGLGGTVASLHGFINSQGGKVICVTTLAASPMGRVPISLAEGTALRLNKALDGGLRKLVNEEFGYDVDCLTEREAQFLLGCGSADEFRVGVDKGRNG